MIGPAVVKLLTSGISRTRSAKPPTYFNRITYFSTTPLTLIQASSAALAKCDWGWAILTNSARSATLQSVSDSSSNISTIGRVGFDVASSIRRSVAVIAWSFSMWNPSKVVSSGLLNRPLNKHNFFEYNYRIY